MFLEKVKTDLNKISNSLKVNKHIILIPVYNDWNSLNRLLREIDLNLKQLKGFRNEVLIINDNSTKKIKLKKILLY